MGKQEKKGKRRQSEQKKAEASRRRHSVEFKVDIAERMLNGENVSALSQRHGLPRSMMYRWRDAFRQQGAAGLKRGVGRPPGSGQSPPRAGGSVEEQLRRRIGELEQKVGRQAVENDFLKRVFKRVSELPKARGRGDSASIRRSGE